MGRASISGRGGWANMVALTTRIRARSRGSSVCSQHLVFEFLVFFMAFSLDIKIVYFCERMLSRCIRSPLPYAFLKSAVTKPSYFEISRMPFWLAIQEHPIAASQRLARCLCGVANRSRIFGQDCDIGWLRPHERSAHRRSRRDRRWFAPL